MLLATRWVVQALDPRLRGRCPGPYHPAGQYWPLQVTLLAVLLALAAVALASGWHATWTRAV
jgi:hypothetical protein